MFASSLISLGQLSPRTHRVMTPASTFALPLSTAHGMVDWIHDHAPDVGASSQPASSAGLSTGDIHMVGITDLTYGGVALLVDSADFAGGEFDQGISAFAVGESRLGTCAADHLGSATWDDLNVVNGGAERDGF